MKMTIRRDNKPFNPKKGKTRAGWILLFEGGTYGATKKRMLLAQAKRMQRNPEDYL